MLKTSASFVLASLRGSTYRVDPLGYRNHLRGFSVRQDLLYGRTAHTKCGLYLLAYSLAAALLDGLFEHPAECSPVVREVGPFNFHHAGIVFPQAASLFFPKQPELF